MLVSNPEQTARVWTVSDLTADLKKRIETRYQGLTVSGEITGMKRHISGHWYFTLKDAGAQITAVMWRGNAMRMFFQPQDGMEVVCRGNMTVYEPRGNYQLVVQDIQPRGEGVLRKAFEELKHRLYDEGLFREETKVALPPFPRHVGVITSPTGAAIRDIISVVHRRHSGIHITVIPTLVQGEGAAASIVQAIKDATQFEKFDVLILARGGGSIEDLWCFNEEIVARAVYACPVPIISAVGHEIDFTITDFVADVRAATPSVAAEIVAPAREELISVLRSRCEDLHESVKVQLDRKIRGILDSVAPTRLQTIESRLKTNYQRVGERFHALDVAVEHALARNGLLLDSLQERIAGQAPDRILAKGYAYVHSLDRSVRSAFELHSGDPLTITFHDGKIQAKVNHG